jgi:lactate dehydrogenase-like 2-hydroxyacid dehydrogenase
MMRRMSKDATPRRPRVFVYRGVDGAEGSYRELERAGCALALGSGRESRAEMLEQTRGSDVLLGATYRGGIIDRTLLEASAGLRLISKYTIGVDDVDIASASELGILVTHCPTEANWDAPTRSPTRQWTSSRSRKSTPSRANMT